ncbi:Laminin subunit alpha-2 [Linum perenne]
MPLFAFKSNNHFVTSSDGAILQVHELTKSSDHLSSIHKSDWKKIATISPGLDDDDDDMSYNGLLFFDGHGRIKGRIALTMLAQHLKQLHLLVSPEGYCFQEVSEIGTYPDFGIHYLRLNDLFSWPRHEVDLVTINVWSRLELTYSLPKYKNTTSTTIIGGRVNKEKYAELEKLVKEKDKELEKLKEEMDEKDDEENIQRIEELEKFNKDLEEANKAKDKELKMLAKSKNMGEMQRQLKKKDNELQSLKKKKDEEDEEKAQRIEELEKLNEDLAEENKAKDEELQMLEKVKNMVEMRRQLKKKDDELRLLKKKKDAEEEIQAQRIKELEKFNEDLEEANNAKDEELQKLANSDYIREMQKQLKKKDDELQMLKKKIDNGGIKSSRYDEVEKLKEELEMARHAKDYELQKLRKQKDEEDQHKQVQKKDKELRMLKKMKDEEEAKAQRIEELEKLNEDLEEANKAKEEELQKLAKSKNTGELQRQLKKKDDELKILKKKKDEEEAKAQRIEELEKLNEELEEANKAKDEELQKIKKKKPSEEGNKATKIAQLEKLKEQMEDTIATKDEELEKIKKEKDEEIRKMLKKKEAELRALKDKKNDDEEKSRRIEELEKEKEEMEVANVARDEELQKLRKGRNDELQKLLREKNHEIRVLEKKKEDEKNDEEAKARKAEGELEEVKDQLSFSVARVAHVNKELEQCQKLSWAILPSTKFVPQSADAREMHLTRRQRCPPEKLSCNPQLSFPHVFNSPKLVDKMYIWSSNNVKLVDEENSTAWPPPPTIDMRVGAGVQDFDKNDWWYVKTTHPEGGLTMLVYYDGKRSQISLYNNSVPLPLPFTKGAVEFTTHTYNFSFFDLPPLGMRLGFTYRP